MLYQRFRLTDKATQLSFLLVYGNLAGGGCCAPTSQPFDARLPLTGKKNVILRFVEVTNLAPLFVGVDAVRVGPSED
jgi:hypothetical protein